MVLSLSLVALAASFVGFSHAAQADTVGQENSRDVHIGKCVKHYDSLQNLESAAEEEAKSYVVNCMKRAPLLDGDFYQMVDKTVTELTPEQASYCLDLRMSKESKDRSVIARKKLIHQICPGGRSRYYRASAAH